jgi:RHS repeat-associated protein
MEMDASEEPQGATIKVQTVSLPKGGGALPDMGEQLRPNPFNGTAAFSIPIKVSPCRGAEPSLSLGYASGRGNGVFGLGFGLSSPSISRRISKGIPRYDDSDVFVLEGQWLAPVTGATTTRTEGATTFTVTRYQPAREGAFARIERWVGIGTDDDFWRLTDRDDTLTFFGRTREARVADPDQPDHVFEWLLEARLSPRGDATFYIYKQENAENIGDALFERNRTRTANRYPERICYGNDTPVTDSDGLITALKQAWWHFEAVFDYGEYDLAISNNTPYRPVREWPARQDPFSSYLAGFERRTHRLCQSILMFHSFNTSKLDPILVRAVLLGYDETPEMARPNSVITRGYRHRPDQPAGSRYVCQDRPALLLGFSAFKPVASGREFTLLEGTDGLPPTGMQRPPNYTFLDLHGEGVPGILYADGSTVFYRPPQLRDNGGGAPVAYGPAMLPGAFPIERRADGETLNLLDLDGNGRMALASTGKAARGFYLTDADKGGWRAFQPFRAFPTDYAQAGFEFADLANDGRMDLVSIAPDVIKYYPSHGTGGYGAAERRPQETGVPPKAAARPTDLIGFADVLGAGSPQRVRVSDGMVECWPNLGYGQFGDRVQLAGAPLLAPNIEAGRIQFADIDGSGTADLAVVYSDRVEIFLNRAGNSFAAVPLVVKLPRSLRVATQVSFADVLGRGTQCLVFTDDVPEPRQWYYDFCPDGKPYLLTEIDNGLGSRITVSYTSSTFFSLRDKAAGQRWITRLPFPVQVVSTIERLDLIAKRTTSSFYEYHDGYFDPVDREFRGFAMVELREVNRGAGLPDSPTLRKRTWYCPGAWREAHALANRMNSNRWNGDPTAPAAPPMAFDWPDGAVPDGETIRQAYVALAGVALREEVFDRGDQAASGVPLTVTQYGQALRCLQAAPNGSLGIYYPYQRESLIWTYEGICDPVRPDPRATHDLTLELDGHGNPLRAARLTYPRQVTGEPDYDDQQRLLRALCTVKTYEPAQDAPGILLFGLERDERRYSLNGLTLPPHQTAFTFDQAVAAMEQALTGTGADLLDWRRWKWVEKDGVPLPQRLLQAIPKVAFDGDALSALFAPVAVPGGLDGFLTTAGGYVREDAFWWATGSSQVFSNADGFFQPIATLDAFASLGAETKGCTTSYRYDVFNLLLTSKTVTAGAGDVAPQTVAATLLDYQSLQPQQITDANGMISEAITDVFGEVVATSRQGWEFVDGAPRQLGFSLLPVDGAWPLPENIEELLAAPASYLRGAQSYHFRDLSSWRARGEAAHEVVLSASDYPDGQGNPALPIGISIAHKDGEGRDLQKAKLVPSGTAWLYQSGVPLHIGEATTRWQISSRELHGPDKQILRAYVPFFLDTWQAIDDSVLAPAIAAELRTFDVLGRIIRTDLPKGGMARAFFTRTDFTAWRRDAYDADDTVRESEYYRTYIDGGGELPPLEKDALIKAAVFEDTPGSECLDGFGRTVRQLNRLVPDGTPDTHPLASTVALDVLGRALAAGDPRLGPSGIVTTEQVYALSGATVKVTGSDTGPRWELKDAGDNAILMADERGFVTVIGYDGFRRQMLLTVHEGGSGPGRIAEWVIHGDSLDVSGKPVYDPTGRNIMGQVCRRYDGAGVVVCPSYGLAGKPLECARQMTAAPSLEPDWQSDPASDWAVRFDALEPQLGWEVFSAFDQYDGAERIIEHVNEVGETVRTAYDVAGRRRRVTLQPAPGGPAQIFLSDATYSPQGQRATVTMSGPGGSSLLVTDYEYDPATQLLIRQATIRTDDGKLMQELRYIHDPVGNLTHVEDGADGGAVSPDRDYTFDALYRLIKAEGRAHSALTRAALASGRYDDVFQVGHSLNDATAVSRYTASYRYDDGNNLKEMTYVAGTTSIGTRWTQTMRVSDTSNRAVDPDDFTGPIDEAFDLCGNQIWLTGSRRLAWNYSNALRQLTIIDRGAGEEADAQYFAYDHTGMRVRKATCRKIGGNDIETRETLYFGGVEITRTQRGGSVTRAYHRTRVMDGELCLAECLTWANDNPPPGVTSPQVRYQLSDRQQSAVMELDATGQLISYEEYSPYGATVFALGPSLVEVSLKSYRFGGKERDPVSGLAYHGARYYAPWLSRWLSSDPAGTRDGLNLYAYVRDNPATLADPDGLEGKPPDRRPTQQGFFQRVLGRFWSSSRENEENQEEVPLVPLGQGEEQPSEQPSNGPAPKQRWGDFWNDAGGSTTPGVAVGHQLGIFPIYNPVIVNNDAPGTWAHRDTQAHEEVHAFIYRNIGIMSWLQNRSIGPVPIGAPLLHLEESIAYTVGHAAAGRFHAIPFAWLEAFGSMSGRQALVSIPLAVVTGGIGMAIGLVVATGMGLYAGWRLAGRGLRALGAAIVGLFG